MRRNVSLISYLLICVVILSLVACAGVQTTKPYQITKIVAEEILFDARILMNQGAIKESEFTEIKDVYDKLRDAQNLLIDARLDLIAVNTVESAKKFDVAMSKVRVLASKLISLATKYGIQVKEK